MPDFTGLELCQRIRCTAAKPYTYIILMTSKSEQADIVKGLEAGADDYLTKPFDAAELRARIGLGRRIVELNRELVAQSKKLEEAAHTDPLTGLPNRRAIEAWASKQLRGAARHGFPFWVVVADLDSFKSINDTFGHEAGDDVLRQFSDILRKNIRASDICGRLGGDEFLIVLTHVNPEHIEMTVSKFRDQLFLIISISREIDQRDSELRRGGFSRSRTRGVRHVGAPSRPDALRSETRRARPGQSLVSVAAFADRECLNLYRCNFSRR